MVLCSQTDQEYLCDLDGCVERYPKSKELTTQNSFDEKTQLLHDLVIKKASFPACPFADTKLIPSFYQACPT